MLHREHDALQLQEPSSPSPASRHGRRRGGDWLSQVSGGLGPSFSQLPELSRLPSRRPMQSRLAAAPSALSRAGRRCFLVKHPPATTLPLPRNTFPFEHHPPTSPFPEYHIRKQQWAPFRRSALRSPCVSPATHAARSCIETTRCESGKLTSRFSFGDCRSQWARPRSWPTTSTAPSPCPFRLSVTLARPPTTYVSNTTRAEQDVENGDTDMEVGIAYQQGLLPHRPGSVFLLLLREEC